MDKVTIGLIAIAAAIGWLAARDARARAAAMPVQITSTPRHDPKRTGDDRGVVLRNESVDDNMAVQSPFDADRGMVRRPAQDGPRRSAGDE
jgi:hypothetical protein